MTHEIVHPKGRHRVEFVRDRDGHWHYKSSNVVKKRWRDDSIASRSFESYAAALFEAETACPWIAQALTPNAWSVEHLRFQVFSFAVYSEYYGYTDHCTACRKTIAPSDFELGDAEVAGYVTRYEIPSHPERWHWNWVCSGCFEALSKTLQWQVSSDSAKR